MTTLKLEHDRGTILITEGPVEYDRTQLPGMMFDPRSSQYRAPGRFYRAIIETLIAQGTPYTDAARGWANKDIGWKLQTEREAFPHQTEAVATWQKTGRRGVVILPTGTGKTFVAVLAIARTNRPTLVVTPTIDLMRQWSDQLRDFFGVPVGSVGGGDYDFQDLTVTTYDSAYIHLERWAPRYGLIVCDECHHLPGPSYSMIAQAALAPFRLGLTATPERSDGAEATFPDLLGPIVYRREIQELSGDYLAEYQTRRVYVELTEEEAEEYRICREAYRSYLTSRGISLGSPGGWQRFLMEASRTPDGAE
ncbi:MAG: DEAD/DEAH box helicase family protein, partial [Gemmataceae bacterium]